MQTTVPPGDGPNKLPPVLNVKLGSAHDPLPLMGAWEQWEKGRLGIRFLRQKYGAHYKNTHRDEQKHWWRK
jgi:hypothetical protein